MACQIIVRDISCKKVTRWEIAAVKSTKRVRGRPPKPEAERRGRNITFRTPGGLRNQLEEAAKASGRALSEEVVHRLLRDFQWEQTQQSFNNWLDSQKEEIERGNLEAAARRHNWKKVHGARFGEPNWISADNHALPADGFVPADVSPQQPGSAVSNPQQMELALGDTVKRVVVEAIRETFNPDLLRPVA